MTTNYLLVTFDLKGAKPGDGRYGKVNKLLERHGHVTYVFRQVRLVKTKTVPSRLAPLIIAITGPVASVLVVRVAGPTRFVLGNSNPHVRKRDVINDWLKEARARRRGNG